MCPACRVGLSYQFVVAISMTLITVATAKLLNLVPTALLLFLRSLVLSLSGSTAIPQKVNISGEHPREGSLKIFL